jgi:DNA-binding NtrC family response regulator
LQNVIERAVILSIGGVLRVPAADLRVGAATPIQANKSEARARKNNIPFPDREYVRQVLKETGGRMGETEGAAARLGL